MSDSKAGLLPADIETFAKYFSRIKVRDTPDVRRACDLVADIVRKAGPIFVHPTLGNGPVLYDVCRNMWHSL